MMFLEVRDPQRLIATLVRAKHAFHHMNPLGFAEDRDELEKLIDALSKEDEQLTPSKWWKAIETDTGRLLMETSNAKDFEMYELDTDPGVTIYRLYSFEARMGQWREERP